MRRERLMLCQLLERALPSKARARIYSVDLVDRRWAGVVGDELARRSEPEALVDGVLTVRVVDPVWGRMILKLSHRIIPALNRAIGTGLVRRINFTKRERLERMPALVAARSSQAAAAPPESLLRAAEAILDPELKALVTRSAARYLQAHRDRKRS